MAPTQRRPTSILAVLLVAGVVSACSGADSPSSTSSSAPTTSNEPTIGSAGEVCEAYGRRHLPEQRFFSVSLGTSPAMGLVAPEGTFQCTFIPSAFPRMGPCVTDVRTCSTTLLLDLNGTVRQYIGGSS